MRRLEEPTTPARRCIAGVNLSPLEALEPDLSRYRTKERRLTGLSINGILLVCVWVTGVADF